MTGHQHSAQTPSLSGPLKSWGTFEARVQQRHILCHWPRFDKKGLVSVLKKRSNVCAWTNEGKEKHGEKGAEEVGDLEVVRATGPSKTGGRIMNILKSHKALPAGSHSRGFSSRVHREQRQPPRCFLYLRFLFILMPLSLASVLPSFLFRPLSCPFPCRPFLFSAAHTISFLASAVASRSINARFLRWHNWLRGRPAIYGH